VTTSGDLPVDVLDFILETTFDDLPPEVVGFGQRCLLDLLGVAAAGRTTELSTTVHDHATSVPALAVPPHCCSTVGRSARSVLRSERE
jgi:2-methylcitrate dehydratase PrpD